MAPVDLDDVPVWAPLGDLSPRAHVFPNDHQGVYVAVGPGGPDAPVTVRSPGQIHVLRVRSVRYHETAQTDFALDFQPCAEIYGYLGHVATLTPELQARLGPFDQFCSTCSPNPGLTVTQCQTRQLDVTLPAGETIGTVGDFLGLPALDFGLHDRRISGHVFANPSRWQVASNGFDRFHVVPASAYYSEPARSAIAAKLDRWFHGFVPQTALPIGGTVAVDVPGTAQGAWFRPGLPTHPESPHVALC